MDSMTKHCSKQSWQRKGVRDFPITSPARTKWVSHVPAIRRGGKKKWNIFVFILYEHFDSSTTSTYIPAVFRGITSVQLGKPAPSFLDRLSKPQDANVFYTAINLWLSQQKEGGEEEGKAPTENVGRSQEERKREEGKRRKIPTKRIEGTKNSFSWMAGHF